MKHLKTSCLCILSLVMLSGCVSRIQADEKLVKGCRAGAEIFVEEDFEIKTIKDESFQTISTEFGDGFREVTLNVEETNDYYDRDETYICLFAERMALFGLSYSASIYQIKIYDNVFGMGSGTIGGDVSDHMNLNAAVQNAMRD